MNKLWFCCSCLAKDDSEVAPIKSRFCETLVPLYGSKVENDQGQCLSKVGHTLYQGQEVRILLPKEVLSYIKEHTIEGRESPITILNNWYSKVMARIQVFQK